MFNFKKEVSMKRLLFFAVSAILAGASYCSSVSEKIVAKVTNSDTQIEQQQEQTLVLEQSSAEFKLLGSHSSHSSHSSHRSHSSHYSSR
jgi:cell division protein FtsB